MSGLCDPWCLAPVRNQCHCTGCHRTFRNVTGFEAHWVGRGDGRHCIDPATIGLAERDGLWATPEGHLNADRSAALLRKAAR